MAKHTYGFPMGTRRADGIASAIQQARNAGFLPDADELPDEDVSVEIVPTFTVVIRTAERVTG